MGRVFYFPEHPCAFGSALRLLRLPLLTCAVGADTSRDEQIAERFASADTNHDGQLTLAEAQADMPRIAANFSKIDADKSGAVTLPEIEAKADR